MCGCILAISIPASSVRSFSRRVAACRVHPDAAQIAQDRPVVAVEADYHGQPSGDRGRLVVAGFLQPAHIPFDVGPAETERVSERADLGMSASLAAKPAITLRGERIAAEECGRSWTREPIQTFVMTLDRSVSDQPKGKVVVSTAPFAQAPHCFQHLPFLD
jgi:hypothetical protein